MQCSGLILFYGKCTMGNKGLGLCLACVAIFLLIAFTCGCKNEPDKEVFPSIKTIIDYDKYDSLCFSHCSSDYRYYFMGYIEGSNRFEKIKFADDKGQVIDADLYVSYPNSSLLNGLLLFDLSLKNGSESRSFCLQLSSGLIIELNKDDASLKYYKNKTYEADLFNDGSVYYSGYDGIVKIEIESGKIKKTVLLQSGISGFDYIFVDKYGNIFGKEWGGWHSLLTKEGKLEKLPLEMTVKKGINGIAYFSHNGQKGFFSETGERINLTDEFYPAFTTNDIFSADLRQRWDFYVYKEDNELYVLTYEQSGFNCFRDGIYKYTLSPDAENPITYTEETVFNIESIWSDTSNDNNCIHQLGKDLYYLSKTGLKRLEITTGNITTINDEFYEYKSLSYIGNNKFIMQVVNNVGNLSSVCISTEGIISEIDQNLKDYDSVIWFKK